MLTDRTRKIVEYALGRALNADEEAGFPALTALPPDVLVSVKRIRDASNSVTLSVYLQHVVPSATLEQVREFMDELDSKPADKLWRRTTAEPGHELCPSCLGRGSCKWCGGSGVPLAPTSKSCDGCAGQGTCALCDGAGQLVAGHLAFAEWSKRTATPSQALELEGRALSERMHANRVKQMQRRAVEKPAPRLPADSPIFRKWETDGFFEGAEDERTDAAGLPAAAPQPLSHEEGVRELLELLASPNPRTRVGALRSIAANAYPDERVLAACERLIDDRAIALLGIPYRYGEVRWVAADAIAAVRQALGRPSPVVIPDVMAPVSAVRPLAEAAGVPMVPAETGVESSIKTLERLAALGKLPRRKITR